jgi:hypothetical protein
MARPRLAQSIYLLGPRRAPRKARRELNDLADEIDELHDDRAELPTRQMKIFSTTPSRPGASTRKGEVEMSKAIVSATAAVVGLVAAFSSAEANFRVTGTSADYAARVPFRRLAKRLNGRRTQRHGSRQ